MKKCISLTSKRLLIITLLYCLDLYSSYAKEKGTFECQKFLFRFLSDIFIDLFVENWYNILNFSS